LALGWFYVVKAAVFDLDHTLFDRYETIKKISPLIVSMLDVADDVTAKIFAEELSYADKQYVHKGWRKIHAYLIERNIFKTIPTYEEYAECVLKCFKTTTAKYDFAIPVLTELKNMGLKIGLITNGDSELQKFKLMSLGMTDCFDEVIISGETHYEKPDARIFQLMARSLGVKTGEMMYIGDHPLNDVEGSRKAGCIPVWVKTTGTWVFPEIEKPDLQVETVAEIPELIKKINER